MSKYPDVIWLNTNPSFSRFSQHLINYLSKQMRVAEWQYFQSPDEATGLDIALVLLHDYLKSRDQPINLIGHSTGGLLGLLYARKYPERVKSLTLLGVGVYPTIDWQIQYYTLSQLIPCSRERLLSQMINNIFGCRYKDSHKNLRKILEQDLNTSPSPHSLYQKVIVSPGGVVMPLMICGSLDDLIVDNQAIQGWQPYLKTGDRLWQCAQGHHFFHFFHYVMHFS